MPGKSHYHGMEGLMWFMIILYYRYRFYRPIYLYGMEKIGRGRGGIQGIWGLGGVRV